LTIERMRIKSDGNIQLNAYGAGTLVTDASGNITVSSGGGAGGPYLPVANPTFTGVLTGPSADLEFIKLTAANPGILMKETDITDKNWDIQVNSGNLKIYEVNDARSVFNERVTFEASGNVGIGETNPSRKLDVVGVIQVQGNFYSTVSSSSTNLATASGGQLSLYNSNSTDNNFNNIGGYNSNSLVTSQICFVNESHTNRTGAIAFLTHNGSSMPERMRITSAGNVGIGTDDPKAKLHTKVTSSTTALMLENSTGGSGAYVDLDFNTYNTDQSGWANAAASIRVIDNGLYGGDITFRGKTAGIGNTQNELMRIEATGNVGIGVTGPGHKLDVDGVIRARQGQLIGANSFTDEAQTTFFTNGVSDLNVDIVLPNASLWGYLEVEVTGFYNNQDAHGKLTKIYAMGLNVGGTMYSSESRVSDAVGPVNANVNLGPIRWDSTTSTYRIRLAHIVSTGNNFAVKISAFTISGKALNLTNSWSLSPLYTESTAGLTQQYVYYNDRLGIGTSTPSALLDIQGTQGQLFSVTDDLSGDIFSVADISGVPIMNVNSNGTSYFDGNVGIGTTSPDSKLDVKGPSATPADGNQTLSITNSTGGTQLNLGTAENSYGWIEAREGSTLRNLLINPNGGNVGIGATNPGVKLDVVGTVRSYSSAGNYGQIANGSFQAVGAHGGTFMLDLDNTSTADLVNIKKSGSSRFYIQNGGNVGIGTISPTAKLHLEGDAIIEGVLRADNVNLGLGGAIKVKASNTASDQYVAFGTTPSGSSGNATFTEKMRIDSNGDVGIGVTNPLVKLHVNQGNVTGTVIKASGIGAQIEIQSSTAGDAHLYMRPNTSSNKAAVFKMTAGTNYNWRWQDDATTPVVFMQLSQSNSSLSVKGDIIAYGAPSDKRYKENIKPIESALDKAVKLQGVTFDWKESDSILDIKEDIGFIAQDVQKVVPELVRENEDGKLSLRYQGVTPILLEAIKELKAEIDLLKSKPCNCNNCNCSI
jgi:hypothetical protein